MKRVVISGIGIVSCLGNDQASVLESLQQGRSGIKFQQQYADMGMRSHVAGSVEINIDDFIDRKVKRFMGDAAAFSYIAMQQAIEDAQLDHSLVSNIRTGIIMGSGGASSANQVEAADILRERGIRRVGPYMVPRTMASTVSACLATPFQIKGVNYSISSACATSTHCIGNAYELIQIGKQDIVFAGGGEEEHWSLSMLFDAMGALSTKYNETPEKASRTYDADRDGFVIAGGGATVVVEELEHAQNVAHRYMLNWSVMAQPQTVRTWLLLPEKALCVVCRWQCRRLMALSITSTPMAPAHPLVIPKSYGRLVKPLKTRFLPSAQVNRWQDIH